MIFFQCKSLKNISLILLSKNRLYSLNNIFPNRLVSQLLLPHEKHVYLVATSGDTGSAVIDGFSRISEEEK